MTMFAASQKVRIIALWAALALLLVLMTFSIYGAFIGAERAQAFFNSLPLAFYWAAFALLLLVSLALFPRLAKTPPLLLIHLGCVLVLAGGMWGSQAGHTLRNSKVRRGHIVIHESQTTNEVFLSDATDAVEQLPFAIRLRDFRIEYYEPGILRIRTQDGVGWRLSAEPGTEYFLGDEYGSVTIVKTYRNFKLAIEGDKRVVTDVSGDEENPAVEVLLKTPDGGTTTRYVFERFAGHAGQGEKLTLAYSRTIREYISEVDVITDGKVAAHKRIEVNHPLRYAGYGFYQHSYDELEGKYTVLQVVSLSGLTVVHAGYIALSAGVLWRLWFHKLRKGL